MEHLTGFYLFGRFLVNSHSAEGNDNIDGRASLIGIAVDRSGQWVLVDIAGGLGPVGDQWKVYFGL